MVSGPLRTPPSLWKTGKASRAVLRGPLARDQRSGFGRRKARLEARVVVVRMVGAREGGRRVFFSDSGRASPDAGSPDCDWGSQLALTSWARRPETLQSFPARSHPPFLPPLLAGARARGLSTPSLPPLPETRRREGTRHKSAGATVTFPPGSGGRPPLPSARARRVLRAYHRRACLLLA